jgi:MFS family permease
LGRILFGWISDKISGKKLNGKTQITALTINNYCLLLSGLATIAIPVWDQYWVLMIDCILFGLFICKSFIVHSVIDLNVKQIKRKSFYRLIASYMSLTSIILVDLLGIETLSTTFGLISCFRGISSILGPPLAGALYDITGSFTFCFITAGILLIISSIISFFVAKYEK